jgi:acetate---CoA ligase (ADP-forming)
MMGNKMNVDEVDLLEYYLKDPETKIVFLYLEGFSRAKDFFDLARSSEKPIIVQKSNRSGMSHGIARSHTGAMASDDEVVDGALRQAGVIRVENLEELIHCVKVLSLPPLNGYRLACMASTGGKAVMCADECKRFGLELPAFSPEFLDWRRTLGRGEYINPTNPLDLGDIYDMETQIRIIQKLQLLEEVDAIFYVIPYSSAWSVNLNYGKVFDFCIDVNKDSKVPVLVYIDFDAPMERFHFYETYSARFFNSLPATLKAIKQVGEVRLSKQ